MGLFCGRGLSNFAFAIFGPVIYMCKTCMTILLMEYSYNFLCINLNLSVYIFLLECLKMKFKIFKYLSVDLCTNTCSYTHARGKNNYRPTI